MSNRILVAFMVVALLVLLVWSTLFTVKEQEQAIKLRFGQIVGEGYEPGLHVKVPFIDTIVKFEDRILTLDNQPEEFLTSELKYLQVDFFVKWRIADVGLFYRSTQGSMLTAANRLQIIIKNWMKEELSRRTIRNIVAAERSDLFGDLLVSAGAQSKELGISLIDVRVKRVDLPDDVRDSAYRRMSEERKRTANQLRAEGFEAAEAIRADAERERTVILAEAYRDAERLRGQGDARSAEIYAGAFEKNPEFYAFYRSMQAYKASIGRRQDVLILSPDSSFFRYLGEPGGKPQ